MTKLLDDAILFLVVLLAVLAMAFTGCETLGVPPAAAQEYEPSTSDELVGEVIVEGIAWNDSTRLALGQCFVAEARWRNRTEHSAIAHLLERRWRRYNAAHPSAPISFETQVRAYCHIHRAPQADSSNGWALNLPWGPMVEDADPSVRVRQWADDWDFTRETVTLFEQGELVDPMPLSMTFGGEMDSAGAELVYLGPTAISIEDGARILLHNRFYALRSTIARAAARRTHGL